MADDIDIEEHDVLESLRRRQVPAESPSLPDTSLVKTEPVDTEYNDSHYEDSNYEYNWDWEKHPEIKVEPHSEDEFPFGRIILGTKPATPPPENPPDVQDSQENYNYNMSLVLDDWGPMLDNSDCYCKECQILFATVNALDAHKMIAHSFLVATEKEASPERNKAIKSTAKPSSDQQTCEICQYHFIGRSGKFNLARHYREVHKVDPETVANKRDFKSWRVCNHCNKYFPDDTSLVKHLYELLPLNNKTPTKDDKKAVNPSAVKVAKPVLNVDKKDPKPTVSREVKANVNVPEPVKVKNVSSTLNKNANRIILGSKTETKTVEEKPVEKSDDMKCWRCEICNVKYNRKYYLRHMRMLHQNVPVTKLYKTKDTAIIKTPDKVVPSNSNVKSPDKVVLSNCKVRYKCIVCNEILTSYHMSRKHKKKHPHMYGKKMLIKLVKTSKIQKDKPPKITTSNKEITDDTNDILVSKSTIFKCNRCSVHFLTCTGACQHSIVCETSSNIRDWACPKCQRVFKSVEKSAHEYQHKLVNNKFKVYVVYLEMIVRVLCECPDCYICFEEDKFLRHVSGGCKSDAESYFCNECRLPIDLTSKANHDSKHTQGDFTKDDFIKIDYVSSKKKVVPVKVKAAIVEEVKNSPKMMKIEEAPKKAMKRKLEVEEVPAKKNKAYNPDELHLFFCPTCNTYQAIRNKFHHKGLCKDATRNYPSICKYCGLHLSSKYAKTHLGLHERFPSLKLSDFTFTRLTDFKKIKPQPVTYPCKTCHVHFQSKWAKHCHKCGDTTSVNCKVCQKKIQKVVFSVHMQMHNYVIPSQIKFINQNNAPNQSLAVSRTDVKSPKKTLPDLLMKYESLTALWNILYLCSTCDTFTDSYDKVVEHCQNHLTNMENYGVVIMKCQICDMKFDSECYRRHVELHADSKVITKKTFQILKYEYYNLFTSNWFDFIKVPEEQKSQIVSRSIYGGNRCVKMRLLQQGPPEYTLYKCSKCLNCVAPETIVYHVKLANCLKAHKVACSICDMTFAIRSQCDEHEQIHEATGLGVESFRIVAFNDASDLDSNIKIMSYDTENHGSKNKISFADEGVLPIVKSAKNAPKSKSFVFYKCAECHSCQMHITSFRRHACLSTRKKKVCNKCGLLFSGSYLRLHQKVHEKYKISRNNVVVKTVNKEGQVINIKKQVHEKTIVGSPPKNANNVVEKPKLYKCYCGLHYTSLKSIEKHYKMKNCSTVVREKCSQCHLVFDPIEVVNHLCKHHAQTQTKSFDIVTPNKKTLFKCSLCHILFYTKNSALKHKGKCVGKFSGKKCEKCGLAFDVTSLLTHLLEHERNDKLRTDCYVIVKIPDENATVTLKRKQRIRRTANLLFKCQKCKVHFLSRNTINKHFKNHERGINMRSVVSCTICGFRFSKQSLSVHMMWQHKKQNIKEFDVNEVRVDGTIVVPKVKPQARTIAKPKANKQKEVASASPKVTPVIKSEPKVERAVSVYKCVKCALHFTDETALASHYEDRCSKELSEDCDECELKFASKNIKEHKMQHENGVTLILNINEDARLPGANRKQTSLIIKEESVKKTEDRLDRYDNRIYKCIVCNIHYNSKASLTRHTPKTCKLKPTLFKCEICDIHFTRLSLHRHTLIHERYNFKKEDFVFLTMADLDDSKLSISTTREADTESHLDLDEDTVASLDISSEMKPAEGPAPVNVKVQVDKKDDVHFLYKCAECNLYFVTTKACHKHITDHKALDSKNYIECKLCGFQFTIMTLQIHIKKHHAGQFNLENVLVEEYQPNNIKNCEKYYAIEKDQSRLVSTSDDVNNISNTQVENDNEVTSCNEVEKVESSEQGCAQDNVDTDGKVLEQEKEVLEKADSSEQSGAQNSVDIDKVLDQEGNTVLEETTDTKTSDVKVNDEPDKTGE